jgi:hypothetical protein
MTRAAITVLPILQRLQQLRELKWSEPEPGLEMDHPCADAAATLAQLAHLTQLTHITLGRVQAATTSLVATATGMTNLVSFTMYPPAPESWDPDMESGAPEVRWEVLSSRHLSQLLTSCSLLTALSMEEVVLDQAGLDLLLAHPHIVNVTLLAIAATESRVDSPCSWHTLRLAREVDIRTVAYVPLHSLREPLPGHSLLLPPDVPSDNLPQLLVSAATRIATHRHLFYIDDRDRLCLKDYVTELACIGAVDWQGPIQAAFRPTAQSALFAALEPLAGVSEIQGLQFRFHYDPSPTGPPLRVRLGKPDLEALDRAWGSRITGDLWFRGVTVAPGFFLALETCFPQLGRLWLENVERDEQRMVPRIVMLCQRRTRSLRLHLDEDTYV